MLAPLLVPACLLVSAVSAQFGHPQASGCALIIPGPPKSSLFDHTNQVCYESFRRKILLAAGVPEEASIYGGVNNYLSQLRQSMEDDRKRLKDKFVARIKVAESEMAQDKEAIGNQQAKDEGQINHIASRLRVGGLGNKRLIMTL